MLVHQNVAKLAVFLLSKRDDSELGSLQNRSKGRILSRLLLLQVQLVIAVFNSGLGQCKWQPLFSVSYLVRSCDCSLHI